MVLVVTLNATAVEAADGRVRLLGPCSSPWQAAMERAAASLGRVADLPFLVEVIDQESEEAAAVTDEFADGGHPQVSWHDVPPDQRSLGIGEVPADVLPRLKLVGLRVDVSEGVPAGYVSVLSAEGALVTFSTRNVEGVVPVLVPRADGPVSVTFTDQPPGAESADVIDIGHATAASLDESLGSSITVTMSSGSPSAAINPLAPGELEVSLDMSREAIEQLRESILATAASPD